MQMGKENMKYRFSMSFNPKISNIDSVLPILLLFSIEKIFSLETIVNNNFKNTLM